MRFVRIRRLSANPGAHSTSWGVGALPLQGCLTTPQERALETEMRGGTPGGRVRCRSVVLEPLLNALAAEPGDLTGRREDLGTLTFVVKVTESRQVLVQRGDAWIAAPYDSG
jgi:hypothetical protein